MSEFKFLGLPVITGVPNTFPTADTPRIVNPPKGKSFTVILDMTHSDPEKVTFSYVSDRWNIVSMCYSRAIWEAMGEPTYICIEVSS